MSAVGGKKGVHEEIGNGAGFRRAFSRVVGILPGFEVDGKNMQRQRETGNSDCRLKQITREVRIGVSVGIQVGAMQVTFGREDWKTAGDHTANKAVGSGVGYQIVAGEKGRDEIRHLISELVRNLVEGHDVRT